MWLTPRIPFPADSFLGRSSHVAPHQGCGTPSPCSPPCPPPLGSPPRLLPSPSTLASPLRPRRHRGVWVGRPPTPAAHASGLSSQSHVARRCVHDLSPLASSAWPDCGHRVTALCQGAGLPGSPVPAGGSPRPCPPRAHVAAERCKCLFAVRSWGGAGGAPVPLGEAEASEVCPGLLSAPAARRAHSRLAAFALCRPPCTRHPCSQPLLAPCPAGPSRGPPWPPLGIAPRVRPAHSAPTWFYVSRRRLPESGAMRPFPVHLLAARRPRTR